jgi:hypothetical protein
MTTEALPSANHPVQPREPRSLKEWLWRGRALEQVRQRLAGHSQLTLERLKHARAASELAERVVDPVDPLRAGPAPWLALPIYREAAYWALLAQDDALEAPSLDAALQATPRELQLFAADGEEGLQQIRGLLLERSAVQETQESVAAQTADARLLKGFVDALIREKVGAEQELHVLLFQRWLRVGLLALVLIALVAVAAFFIHRQSIGPDLAAGKPWRVSSSEGACNPAERMCLGARTAILFHTRNEKNPWFEIDLGKPTSFSVIEVVNRDSCCPDRAIPLVVEVSNDQKTWKEVIRRNETFDTWRAKFKQQNARYVRVRVARMSVLHLVRVSVRED